MRVLWRAAAAVDASAALAMERIEPIRVPIAVPRMISRRPRGGDPAAVSRRRLAHRHTRPATARAPRHRAPRARAGRRRTRRSTAHGPRCSSRIVPFIQETFARYPDVAREPPVSDGARARLRGRPGSLPAHRAPATDRGRRPRRICACAPCRRNKDRSTGRTSARSPIGRARRPLMAFVMVL